MQKKIYKIIAAIIVLLLCIWTITNLVSNFPNLDRDGDGVPDHEESKRGTKPDDPDSDDDGLNDKDEWDYWTERSENEGNDNLAPNGDIDEDGIPNILDEDSDGDGISDGDEIENGTDPADPDTDDDGLPDGDESSEGTDPNNPDSDGDGIPDGSDDMPSGPTDPGDLTYGDSSDESNPSRNGMDAEVTCFAIFNPYLLGLKRHLITDEITTDYKGQISDPTFYPLPLSSTYHNNVFVGTITLDRSYNEIRIPSVAPNANIISYENPDGLTFNFYKDGADNYYVKTSDYFYNDKTTLIFTTSADSSYFTLDIPEHLTLDDIPENVKNTPPPSVISKANIVIDVIGLTGETNLKTIVHKLREYFSSFTPGEIPSKEEQPDIYLAMALSKHGCCGIRSHACFITANSIGLPTRLVTNECHAFCEIYIPNNGWTMLQLGGCGTMTCNPDDYEPFENMTDEEEPIDPGNGNGENGGSNGSNGDNGGGTEPIDLLPTTTTITEISSGAYKEDFFYVKGYVKDQFSIGIEDMSVQIFVNKTKNEAGEYANSGTTNSDGYYNILCQVPENVGVGENHVLAHAVRNAVYDESWSDPIIEIYSNTSLNLDMAESVGVGDFLAIMGYLLDASGRPISDQIIKVSWDGLFVGQTITGTDGGFIYLHQVNDLGSYNVYVVFDGSEYLGSSEDSQTITVKDTKTSLTISVTPDTVFRGDQLGVTGTLNSGSNDPMPDSTVNIYYDGKQVSSTTTSSEGAFDESISVPMDSSVGQIIVRARFPGDETYAEANGQETIIVQSETQLSLTSPTDKNIERNETITIGGTLMDDVGTLLGNALIRIDWSLYNTTLYTDETGSFNVNYTIPPTASYGKSTITAKFEGTDYYLSSQDSIEVNIFDSSSNDQKEKEESKNTYILLAIAAIIIVLIVGVIMIFKKQKTQAGPSIEEIAAKTIHDLKTEGDYRTSVINCYKQMCTWLTSRGVSKAACQTPREFAMAAKNYLSIHPDTLYNLTQIFEKARYSKHEINIEDKDKAIKCLNEIIAAPVNIPASVPVNAPANNVGVVNR